MHFFSEPTFASQPLLREVTFARVEDAMDTQTVDSVRDYLNGLLSRPGHVVLDLRRARVDSAGLGAVLSMQHKLDLQGRRLFVVTDDASFHSLLENAGVPHALALFPNVEQAIQQAQQQPGHGYAA